MSDGESNGCFGSQAVVHNFNTWTAAYGQKQPFVFVNSYVQLVGTLQTKPITLKPIVNDRCLPTKTLIDSFVIYDIRMLGSIRTGVFFDVLCISDMDTTTKSDCFLASTL